jgi:hypothetical protein
MLSLENFWRERGYKTYLCHEDGTLNLVQSLDPGNESDDNQGEMDYLAVASDDDQLID